jgi:hypothetical protein
MFGIRTLLSAEASLDQSGAFLLAAAGQYRALTITSATGKRVKLSRAADD